MIHQKPSQPNPICKGTCFNLPKTRLYVQQLHQSGYRAAITFDPILLTNVFSILNNLMTL